MKKNQQLLENILDNLPVNAAFLQAVFERSTVGIAVTDLCGRLIKTNSAYGQMLGYGELDLQGMEFINLAHEGDRAEIQTLFAELLRGEREVFQTEMRYRCQDSSFIWVQKTVSLIREQNGHPVLAIAVVENISACQHIEREWQRWATIVENSPNYIAFTTLDGQTVFVNSAGQKLVGLEGMASVKQTKIIDYLVPEERKLFQEQVLPTILNNGIWTGETQFCHFQTQESIPVEWTVFVIRDIQTGQPVNIATITRDIRKRKQTEEKLRQKSEKLRLALDLTEIGCWDWQITTNEVTWNENHFRLFGLAPSETVPDYHVWRDRIHPEDINRVEQAVDHALQTHSDYKSEYRVIHPDGSLHWLMARGRVIYDTEDRPVQMVGMILDISDRKQTESALQESQRWLEAVLQASPNVLYIYDLSEHRSVYHNRELYSVLGYTPEELQEMGTTTVSKLMHPDDITRFWEYLKVFDTAKDGEIFEFEYRMRHKNGEWRWMFSRDSVFIRTADGKPKQILGAANDITDRKQAEQALKKSEERWQLVLKGTNDGIWDLNFKTQEIFISARCKEMLGYEDYEIGCSYDEWIALIHPDDLKRMMQAQRDYLSRKSSQNIIEYRLRCKDSSYKWVVARVQAVWDEDGNLVRIVGATTDISKRKRAEEALKASESKLNRVLENVNAGICFFRVFPDKTLKYEYCSPGCQQIFGYTAAEFMADTKLWWSRIVPEDIETILLPGFNNIFAERPSTVEYRFWHKDGSLRWNSENVISRRDEVANCWVVTSVVTNITARKQAELALMEREAMLRSIGDNLPNGMIFQFAQELDGSYHFYYLSAGCERLSGVKPEAALQDSSVLFDLVAEEDYPRLLQNIDESYRNLSIFDIQMRLYSLSGKLRWSHIRSAPRRLEDGRTVWDGVELDITDLKRTEEELRQQKEILQTIFDHIPVMVALYDNEGQIQLTNRQLVKVLGWSDEELKGNNILTKCYPDPEDFQKVLDQIQAANGKWQDFKTRTVDGRIIDTSWADVRLSDGSCIGIGQDISDRKRAEEELKQLSTALEIRVQERTHELQESEERFRSAFDNAVNGMALISPDGRLLKVNRALCEILGYSEQELLENLSLDEICHPDDREQHLNSRRQILAGEISRIQIEKRYLHKLGHSVWVICNASLVRDSQGEPLYLVTQIQDITERRAIDRMKNEFISIVSHELRTPLSSIRGSLGLLAAGVLDNDPEVAKQMLAIAASESERLVRLVNDILDLERLEANKVTLNQQWCDAATVIQQAIETVRPLAEENNVIISFLPTRVQIWADEDWIIQTLVNLLSNSVKFSQARTTITISAQDQADRVLFAVKDQGRGIPADKLETIFGRFQQVDASDSRQKGGTGLGLAICRKIIQQHGGRIWAESIPGKGSTFYFTLAVPIE